MHVFLVRHAQSTTNVRWDRKNQNGELTDLGNQQAAALRDWLRDRELTADVIYASTMVRTQETAQYVSEAFGLPIQLDDRIREIGTAYASADPIEDKDLPGVYNPHYPNIDPFSPRGIDMPESESWVQFRARLGRFFEHLIAKHKGEVVYVVAHAGVIAATFENLFNSGVYRHCDVFVDHTSWTYFQHMANSNREQWYLRAHNRVDHLIAAGMDYHI